MNYMKFGSIKLTTSIPMEPPKSTCFFPGCSTAGFSVGFQVVWHCHFFNWTKDWFWVSKSLQICPNMMYIKFHPKNWVKGVHWACQTSKNVYTKKIPNFTCYFLVILSVIHLPKWMHMECKNQGHCSHTWVEDPCKVWGHQSGVM
jgi:hypothetical protein